MERELASSSSLTAAEARRSCSALFRPAEPEGDLGGGGRLVGS